MVQVSDEAKAQKDRAARIGVCDSFLAKLIGKQGIKNQVLYLLNDFFFDEGWSSMTNPESMKEGYNASHTYNNDSINHFIEDFTRWITDEWEVSFKKALEESRSVEKK